MKAEIGRLVYGSLIYLNYSPPTGRWMIEKPGRYD
jgi:hypothetical protein